MSSTNDLYTATGVDDAAVTADQTKLTADQTADAQAHAALVADVQKKGLTVIPGPTPGTFVVLQPNADGTISASTAVDGTASDTPMSNPAPEVPSSATTDPASS